METNNVMMDQELNSFSSKGSTDAKLNQEVGFCLDLTECFSFQNRQIPLVDLVDIDENSAYTHKTVGLLFSVAFLQCIQHKINCQLDFPNPDSKFSVPETKIRCFHRVFVKGLCGLGG